MNCKNCNNRVLVVDDVEINLIIAEELLTLHDLQIETSDNGQTVIDKVMVGEAYDIIFMDLFMPNMDGIETTTKLRALGYNGKIIMLTDDDAFADASKRADVYDLFDGYLPKPIEMPKLENLLHRFLQKHQIPVKSAPSVDKSRLKRAFKCDTENAIKILREVREDGINNSNIELLTSTFHSIKSALANFGESEKSKTAFALEKAGTNGDKEYISTHIDSFIQILEDVVPKPVCQPSSGEISSDGAQDIVFICKALEELKDACNDYSMSLANSTIDDLLKSPLKSTTQSFVEEIRDLLYSDSDFEEASEKIDEFLKEYTF